MLTFLRLLAGAVDSFLFGSYVLCVCFFASEWGLSNQIAFFPVFATCTPIIYFALLESDYGGGSTIGKRLFGLVVLDRGLDPLSFYLSSKRAVFKFLIPVILVLAMQRRGPEHLVLRLALLVLAFVIVPVSICVGSGAVGIEDLLAGTIVQFRDRALAPPVQYRARYLLTVLLVSGALAFPISAALNQTMWGIVLDPFTQIAKKADSALMPAARAVLDDLKSSDLNRYVDSVCALGAVDPFPDSFKSPMARGIGDLSPLKGRRPIAAIEVSMTWLGYESDLTRLAVLQRIAVVLPNFVSQISGPGEFFWVHLSVTNAFGVLLLTKETKHIILYRRSVQRPDSFSAAIIEPDAFFFRDVSLEMVPHSVPRCP
jgi:uncharacterized RDD family membrane protein YckC